MYGTGAAPVSGRGRFDHPSNISSIISLGMILVMVELFAGAISFCKNPSSHQEVQFENPREVVNMIGFADLLLKVISRLPPAKLKTPS
jgi:hypothetical protein